MPAPAKAHLSEDERLALICDAVSYAQKTRAAGAPASTGSKAVREAVFFLWESYGRGKHKSARYRSTAAVGKPAKDLIYDHAIPFTLLYNELLRLPSPTAASVRPLLERLCVAALLTREEDDRLTAAGLRERMPADWNGSDALARYRAAGIEVLPNEPLRGVVVPSSAAAKSPRPKVPATKASADSRLIVRQPSDHPKFQSSEARVKAACLAVWTMLQAEGFELIAEARRDGFSMMRKRDGLTFRIDPKVAALRICIGRQPVLPPPPQLVHSGAQPDWITVGEGTSALAVAYLRSLSRV